MGFADYGPADGFVVVNAHGELSCRLDVRAATPIAEAAGVRLISPDRPGIGLSDPSPGRTVLDWAADVEQLLDRLGIERAGVLGWSMGGQYAAGLGYALATRISRVAIVAGALPLTEDGAISRLGPMDRWCAQISRRCPILATGWFRGMALLSRSMPKQFARRLARAVGSTDAEVVENVLDDLVAMTGEGLRIPSGVVEDYRAWSRPWGFAPEDLEVPVDVWWGDSGRLVPKEWLTELASRIPESTLNIGMAGQLCAPQRYQAILESLAEAA